MNNRDVNLDYNTRDYEGYRSLMLSKLKEYMPEYTDLRQSDAGVVILELNAMCLDILSYYLDSVANECFLVTAEQRSSVLKFCKMLGYTPRFSTSAHYKQIFVKNDKNTAMTIPKGTKVKTYSNNSSEVAYFTTTADLTIPQGYYGNEKQNGEYRFTVDVIHGLRVNNEELIRLSGEEPDQKYSLKYAPVVINNDFNVYVNNAVSGAELWNRVSSFAGSESTSKVYVVEENDYGEMSIIFGNDSFGRIPKKCQITCSYFVGGGESGNVGIGAINTLEDNLAGIKSTQNVSQTEIGYDRETIEEMKVNAPMAHRNIWGALTVKDFAGVTMTYFPDVKSSQGQRASEDWSNPSVDDVNVYILSAQEIARENRTAYFTDIPASFYTQEPYTVLKGNIENFFNSDIDYVDIEGGLLDTGRKVVGVRNVNILPPRYAKITLDCTLMVYPYYDSAQVTSEIVAYLKNRFFVGDHKFNEQISLMALVHEILDSNTIQGIRYLNFDVRGTKDAQGEIHNDLYDYTSRDLIIPKTGAIVVLGNVITTVKTATDINSGGATIG